MDDENERLSEHSVNAISEENPIKQHHADHNADKTDSRRILCCQVRPSPYPILIANIFYFMVMSINTVAYDSAVYNKICYNKFKNLSLCMNSNFTESHPDLQQESVIWGTYNSLAQLPLGIVINLTLCSYCDRVGHKLPYLLPVVGMFFSTGYLALLATPQFLEWPMVSVLGYSVLYSLFGGLSLPVMSSFSYVALITPKKKAAVYMTMCESSIMIGSLIGHLINGPIIDAMSLSTLTYINASFTLIPLFIASVFLADVTSSAVKYTWRDAIGFRHLLDAFKCVFKKRDGYTRLLLNLAFVTLSVGFFATSGLADCYFFYFVKERGMGMTEFSLFASFQAALKCFMGPAVLMLVKKFANPDRNTIIIFACSSLSLGSVIMSLRAIPASAWIGSAFMFSQAIFYGEVRSLQISFCGKDDFGKLFAYDALLQSLLLAASSVIFKTVYSASLAVYPEAFLALSAILLISTMLVTVSIDRIQKSSID